MSQTADPNAGSEQPSMADIASQLEKSADTIVAEVDGTSILAGAIADTMRDLSPNLAALPASLIYQRSLDNVVQQRSLAIKARQLGLDKDPAIKRRVEEAIDHTLANALIRHILPELVTEKAIQDRYDATIAGRPGPVEVQLRIIATATEDAAEAALGALRNGEDFASVARQSSIDATAASGGEAGFAARSRLTPELGAVAFAIMPGQMTQFPVLGSGKWFILKVEGRRQRATPSLAECRPDLTAQLTQEAAIEVIKKTRAAVVVNDYGPTGMRDGSAAPRTAMH